MTFEREHLQTSSLRFHHCGSIRASWSSSVCHVCLTGKRSQCSRSLPFSPRSLQSVNTLLYLISRKGLGCGNRGYHGNKKAAVPLAKLKNEEEERGRLKSMTPLRQHRLMIFSCVDFTRADNYWYHYRHHQPFQIANESSPFHSPEETQEEVKAASPPAEWVLLLSWEPPGSALLLLL